MFTKRAYLPLPSTPIAKNAPGPLDPGASRVFFRPMAELGDRLPNGSHRSGGLTLGGSFDFVLDRLALAKLLKNYVLNVRAVKRDLLLVCLDVTNSLLRIQTLDRTLRHFSPPMEQNRAGGRLLVKLATARKTEQQMAAKLGGRIREVLATWSAA